MKPASGKTAYRAAAEIESRGAAGEIRARVARLSSYYSHDSRATRRLARLNSGRFLVSALIGFKRAVAVCRSVGADESVVEDSYCDANGRSEKTLMPCNTHPCTTK